MKEEKCQPIQFKGKLSVLYNKEINDYYYYKITDIIKYKNFYDINNPELQVDVALLKVSYFNKIYEVDQFGYLVYAALPCAKDKISLHRRFIVDNKDKFLGYFLVSNWGTYNDLVDAVENYVFYSLEEEADKRYKEAIEELTQNCYPFLKQSDKNVFNNYSYDEDIKKDIKLLKRHVSLLYKKIKKTLAKLEELEEKLYE